jgi:hypothetical protein
MSDEQDDDAPQQDTTVASAAAAIEELLKKKPEDGEDGEAGEDAPAKAPETEDTEKPATPDPLLAEATRKGQEADAAKAQFAAALNHLVPQLHAAIAGEFSDIRSPADLARLQQVDPARYNRLILAQNNLAQAEQQRVGLAAQENQAALMRQAEWSHTQIRQLGEFLPELHDADKGPLLARKIGLFAQKSGYTPQQMTAASATDIAMLHRAMRYDDLQGAQAQAKAKAARAPKVSEPGTRAQGGGKGAEAEADFAKLKKSGRTEDAAALFRNILN